VALRPAPLRNRLPTLHSLDKQQGAKGWSFSRLRCPIRGQGAEDQLHNAPGKLLGYPEGRPKINGFPWAVAEYGALSTLHLMI
jgi:hypothetical protein